MNSIEKFADLRQCILDEENINLEGVDLKDYEVMKTVTFDTLTKWPSRKQISTKFNPEEILQKGKNPGLNIRKLHKRGITGKGVKVAIIDQPLLLGHEEYKNKVEQYTMIDCCDRTSSMHGPAVASLLVGKDCGIAIDSKLYYWAEPSWKGDYLQRIQALEQIIEYNKNKDVQDKIRVVSVSIGYKTTFRNLDKWIDMLEKAKNNGIIVINCHRIFGLYCDLESDKNDINNYNICYHSKGNEASVKKERPNTLYVPINNRTMAHSKGEDNYMYNTNGGLSWGAPYLAGVIALGLQINYNLDEDAIMEYLRMTGKPYNGGYIVNPEKFIEKIESTNIRIK